MTENFDALARCWWEAQRLATGTRADRERWGRGEPSAVFAGYEAARERIDQGGVQALEFVVALLQSFPDDSGEAVVGAGPLEDLVTQYGNELSLQIEALARRCPPFRRALASVWLDSGTLAPAAEERLAPWIPALPARKRVGS
ncbi:MULTISPECIES: DUF6869 domain-containing protein [Streptacidiphilus]|uniref:DUF6869 domain-containing protein n=1 Tax=Streptacidiphilus cavernicola TaxID=3342716 RepID=A0ABV6UIH3_9ACTN|nr:hypothetical protein [Streptacidiphilus jeojiense]